MLPLLKFASDGKEHTVTPETELYLAGLFQLNSKDRELIKPSGGERLFLHKIRWARTHLKYAELIVDTSRGKYKITNRGKIVLSSNPNYISEAFLSQFAEYRVRRRQSKIEKRKNIIETKIIQKSKSIEKESQYSEKKSGVMCHGICKKYYATRPPTGDRYALGQIRCQICAIFMTSDGAENNRCKCCNYRIRQKPRNSKYKNSYHQKIGALDSPNSRQSGNLKNQNDEENDSEDWVFDDKEDWWVEESSKRRYEKTHPKREISKDVIDSILEKELQNFPIIERKTYFEFLDYIKQNKISDNNHEIIILKELLEYGKQHKGELAESIAYFNNYDSSNLENIKPFFKIVEFDILVENEIILFNHERGFDYYIANIDVDKEKKLHLLDMLQKLILEFNESHDIPENDFPDANNRGSVNWSIENYKFCDS